MGITRRQFGAIIGGGIVAVVVSFAAGRYGVSGNTPETVSSTGGESDYLNVNYNDTADEAQGDTYFQFTDFLNSKNPRAFRKIDDQVKMRDILNKARNLEDKNSREYQEWQEVDRSTVDYNYQEKQIVPLAIVTKNYPNQGGFFYYNQSDLSHLVARFELLPSAFELLPGA